MVIESWGRDRVMFRARFGLALRAKVQIRVRG